MRPTRRQRRVLDAENRAQPVTLRRMPDHEWAHIRTDGIPRVEVWRSRDFLVQVFAEKDGVERLTVCRTTVNGNDWVADISWDELQRLKRECGRGDRDAVEIYPADADVVNVANMRHLWLAGEVGFKWKSRS